MSQAFDFALHAAGAACFVLGVFHLMLWRRLRKRPDHLLFALTCLSVAAYDYASIGLYGATSHAAGAAYLRGQYVAASLGTASFVWFCATYTKALSRRATLAVSLALCAGAIAIAVDRSPLTLRLDEPITKVLTLPGGRVVSYLEVAPGPVIQLTSALIFLGLVTALVGTVRMWQKGGRRAATVILLPLIVILLGVVNDTLLLLDLVRSVYVFEWTFLAFVFSAGWELSTEIVEAAATRDALRASEERLQLALRGANLGLVDWDLRSGAMTCNERLGQLAGLPLTGTRMTTREGLSRIHPDDRARVSDVTKQHFKGLVPFMLTEFRIQTPGETLWRWIQSLASVVERDVAGKPVRLVGTLLEITERKSAEARHARLEEELRHAHRLDSIGRLAGGIAHDVNNLLLPILGHTDLALANGSCPPALAEELRAIRQAASSARELTSHLLAFARKRVLQLRPLDLNSVITRFEKVLTSLVGESIDFKVLLNPRVGRIRGDTTQIEQILLNLVTNACDALEGRGHLTISTDRKTISPGNNGPGSALPPGSYVALRVEDTGRGMDKETQAKIFEPFFTTKREGQGVGLGLALVWGITKQHGGTVSVWSSQGEGTVFTVLFPELEPSTQAEPEPKSDVIPRGRGETVLLVEDREAVRTLLERMLRTSGYHVLAADGAPVARQIFKRDHEDIRLLVTDVMLTETKGTDLFTELCRTGPGLRALFVSGCSPEDLGGMVIDEKTAWFLQKPFLAKDLARKVREIFDARSGD